MKTFKLLRNSAGISMVEVMMAVSVMGGLSLTVAQLMKNTSESTKQNEAKQENVNLKGLLQDNLNNTTACTNTFGTILSAANVTALSASPTASVTVNNVKDKTATIKFSMPTAPSTVIKLDPLTITSMMLTNYNPTAFTGDFVVNATFKKSANNTVMVKPIRIPINFSFNGTALTACSTMAVGGEWMLGGNAGTVDGTDYIGTSDNNPLNFRVNAQKSGRIDNAGQTFFGYQTGSNLPYGTSGTAFGYRALLNDSGSGINSAFGNNALLSNSSGYQNTAIGDSSLKNNTIGVQNTALGTGAMMSNINGISNTALGLGSMAYGTSGSYNTAVGMNSVYSTSGSSNTGVGAMAIYLTSGSANAALGRYAGSYNTNGSYNTYLGTNSAIALTTGSNNIFIGSNSGTGVVNASNKLYIESTASTTPLIGGDFSSIQVHLNGNVGIGTTTPGTPSTPVVATAGVTKLHVTGGKTILDQEAWKTIPLTAAWTPCLYGGAKSHPKYFKDSNGMVHFKGCIKPTAALPYGFQSVAFSLPAGHNPDTPVAFFGPLVRRPADGMVWAITKSTSWCYLYMDGGGSPNFWVHSETAMPTSDGCELHMVHYRAEN